MVTGRIRRVEEDLEARRALVALCMKYLPEYKHEIGGAIEREIADTDVWAIEPETVRGKAGRRKKRAYRAAHWRSRCACGPLSWRPR